MKKNIVTVLFFIILAFDVFAVATQNKSLHMVFKPFLMPFILLIYIISVSKKVDYLFVLALFFSFLGDVLLLFDEYFVFGLASFLVTHLFFIAIISKFIKQKSISSIIKCWLPFLIYFSGIIYLTYPNLNDLLVPVMVYGLVISGFGMISLLNYLKDKTTANLTLLVGAILFIISDSCIGIDEFYKSHIVFEILIISLYAIAQYYICRVMITKNKKLIVKG